MSDSNLVVDTQNTSNLGISVKLYVHLGGSRRRTDFYIFSHPLPLISISQHITRNIVQGTSEKSRICGALLGTQAGRDVEIHTAFEFLIEGSHIDHDFFRSRQTQFKQVFPTFDVLGWYSTGSAPSRIDMDIHRQLITYNESPLFLQVSPSKTNMLHASSAGELPLAIYETFVDASRGSQGSNEEVKGPAMYFRMAQYQVETGEAERIAVDYASKPSESDEAGQSSLIANLTTQFNAVKMLHDRINILKTYVDGVQTKTTPVDHESLRQIASVISSLPASGDIQEFHQEFLQEYNDLLLTTFLSDLTGGLHELNELVEKFDTAQYTNEETGTGGPRRGTRAHRTGRQTKGDSAMFT